MKKLQILLSIIAAAGLVVAGCSKGGDAPTASVPNDKKADQAASEPVKLKIVNYNAGINSQKDVDEIFNVPVQKKYPNISFELVTGQTLEQMIAAGEVPDLIPTSNFYLNALIELGLVSDLNELVKKEKIDLNRFEPEAINALKQFGKNGELYGMPYTMNYGVLVYNKDIFDKFGVAYPTDNMTWSQVIELGKKLTKMQDGVQYIGLDPGDANSLTRSYSLPVVDEKQEKAVLNTEGYQKVFNLLRQVYDIPGMVANNKYAYGINYFIKDQKMAMIPYWISAYTSRIPLIEQSGNVFQWDLVSYPTFDDKPGVGREVDFHMMVVPPTSKHKEAAYKVLQTLVSDEAQVAMNKGTRLTILQDPALRRDFAKDSKLYDGKNLTGMFKVKPAPVANSSRYELDIYAALREAMKNVVLNNMDINTALRTADEKANKIIAEKKVK
ncbi:ABC transporter substrate-binding protein [Paenibacillus thalictri]|nr:extracellular solute-binding protein [Paenibacillus thalictri]